MNVVFFFLCVEIFTMMVITVLGKTLRMITFFGKMSLKKKL